MCKFNRLRPFCPDRFSAGHTLLELMCALLLSGMIIAAGFRLYVFMSTQYLLQQEYVGLVRDAEAVGMMIAEPVRLAGYSQNALFDVFPKLASGDAGMALAKTRDWSAISPVPAGVAGCDDAELYGNPASGKLPCKAGETGFDVISLRYEPVHITAQPVSFFRNSRIHDCRGTVLHSSQSFLKQIFYARKAAEKADAFSDRGSSLHVLYCRSNARGLNGVSTALPQPLVGGLETFRVRYFVRRPADEAVSLVRAQQIEKSDWHYVTGIALCVRLRGILPAPQAATEVDCNGERQAVPPGDRYQRVTRRFVMPLQNSGFFWHGYPEKSEAGGDVSSKNQYGSVSSHH